MTQSHTFNQEPRLAAVRAGRVIVVGRPPFDAQALDGTQVMILGDALADFTAWLKDQSISSACKALDTTPGTISRIKKALGIADTYDKDSRTTQWRRRQPEAAGPVSLSVRRRRLERQRQRKKPAAELQF